jgi:hypothetical protein
LRRSTSSDPDSQEQNGYVINSLLVPCCTAALELLARG